VCVFVILSARAGYIGSCWLYRLVLVISARAGYIGSCWLDSSSRPKRKNLRKIKRFSMLYGTITMRGIFKQKSHRVGALL